MLRAVVFLVFGALAALLGFTDWMGELGWVAQVGFFLCLLLFFISVLGILRPDRPPSSATTRRAASTIHRPRP